MFPIQSTTKSSSSDDNNNVNPFPSLTSGRRPPQDLTAARRYRSRRLASGPTTGPFGVRTHVDKQGREYRVIPGSSRQEMACRIVMYPQPGEQTGLLSRTGSPWAPRWPSVGSQLVLFRISDQVLEQGTVESVWAMRYGITARIVLREALVSLGPPVQDPRPYLTWIPQKKKQHKKRVLPQSDRVFAAPTGLGEARVPVSAAESEERRGFPAPSEESL